MPRTKTITAVAALLAVILAAPAIAQQAKEPAQTGPAKVTAAAKKPAPADPATLEEMSRQAYEQEKWVSYYGANIKLLNQRPYEPEYMLNVIAACALLNRKNTAYHYFLKMQQQGLSYDLNQNPDTMNIRDTEVYEYLNNLMIEAGKSRGYCGARLYPRCGTCRSGGHHLGCKPGPVPGRYTIQRSHYCHVG